MKPVEPIPLNLDILGALLQIAIGLNLISNRKKIQERDSKPPRSPAFLREFNEYFAERNRSKRYLYQLVFMGLMMIIIGAFVIYLHYSRDS